jgi:hypothetical protein
VKDDQFGSGRATRKTNFLAFTTALEGSVNTFRPQACSPLKTLFNKAHCYSMIIRLEFLIFVQNAIHRAC